MAEFYKFFNSTAGDKRKYQAQDFADYFGSVLSTGLLHTDKVPGMSVVVENGTLNTVVSAGKAIMKGHLYENTTPLTLVHKLPEPTADRIDRVVLRLNLSHNERYIRLFVRDGTPASNPVAPTLQRDDNVYEISLAQIRVRANTVQLRQEDLIDERLKEDVCGLVYSLISIPTSQFQAEWDLFFSNKSAEVRDAAAVYMQELLDAEQALQASLAGFEQQFNAWFANQQTEGFVMANEKMQPNGIPTLDSAGKVPHAQLPAMDYVPLSDKGVAGGVATLGGDKTIPLPQIPASLMVASSRTIDVPVPQLSRKSNEPGILATRGNWFTMMSKSATKTKGMRSLKVFSSGPIFSTNPNYSGGNGGNAGVKVYINGSLKLSSTSTSAIDSVFDISTIPDNTPITMQVEILCPTSFDVGWTTIYGYQDIATSTNEIYDIL